MSWSWLVVALPERAVLGLLVCVLVLLAAQVRTWRVLHRQAREVLAMARWQEVSQPRIEALERRVDRLERATEAREEDARTYHDEDVIGLLDSLLEYNESLRRQVPALSTSGDGVEPGAADEKEITS